MLQRRFHRRFIGRLFLLAATFGAIFLILWRANVTMEQPTPQLSLKAMEDDLEEPFDRFKLSGVTMTVVDRDHQFLRLGAEKIVHKNRTAGLFTYYNLKEIYISDLGVQVYPREATPSAVSQPFSSISHRLSSFFDVTMPENLRSADFLSNLDTDASIVTRLLIDGLSLTIHLGNNQQVVIRSQKAVVDQGGVTLAGDFLLTSSDGKKLSGTTAIWVKGLEGLYFPDEYLLKGSGIANLKGSGDVWVIEESGRIRKSTQKLPADISHRSKLDETEEAMNNYLTMTVFRLMPGFKKVFSSPAFSQAAGRNHPAN